MAAGHDVAPVLARWGDDDAGPMNGESGRKLAERVLGIVQREPAGLSVCDLGCGNGFLAAMVAALGHHVVGIDASERLLALARAHHQHPGTEYRHGLFGPELTRDLARRPFDLVLSIDVIEHLYTPSILIETAAEILKPGGRFVVCTPYHGYLKNLAVSALGHWDAHHSVAWDGGHIKFFSVRTLSAMVERRFAIDRFEYHGRLPWLWKNMICIATKPRA
jgi:2-polyprenyl-3-methyl-5-hydroxy-6-metoxy-1,4-benzoquinol methylase